MTALHAAAGGGLPLGLRIPHIVEQIGSLAGFAAVAGLAILSALYFSQARDLRRLREWAGRAPERAAEQAATGVPAPQPVPGRVVAVPQRPGQPVQPATPAGAPTAAGPAAAAAGAAAVTGVAAPTAPATGANGSGEPTVTKTGDGAGSDEEKEGAAAGADTAKDADAVGGEGAPDGDAAEDSDGEAPADGQEAKEGATDGEEAKEGDGAPARPGMPAPASAAAAAGAAGASVGGPSVASPGSPTPAPAGSTPASPAAAGSAPSPARAPLPQRPPTSVLPPRTGSQPPIRRTGGTAAANRALGPAAAGPPAKRRNPAYIVLAVAGVLILGAAAAIGVPKLVNGEDSGSKPTAKHDKAKAKAKTKTAPIAPGSITVAVLNGTSVTGLATQVGDQVQNFGFNLGTVSNAPSAQQNRGESLAMYAPGHAREARMVAKKLRIASGAEPIDANSREIAGDATVVVIVGSDRAQ